MITIVSSIEEALSITTPPDFWSALTHTDQLDYIQLRRLILSAQARVHPLNRPLTFAEIFELIRIYTTANAIQYSARCSVCGLCELPEGLAVNSRQLRFLLGRCKSSINRSLQIMGYVADLGRAETMAVIDRTFPFIRGNLSELRKWSVRQKTASTTPTTSRALRDEGAQFRISLTGIGQPVLSRFDGPNFLDFSDPQCFEPDGLSVYF
jgi:hypothetical protein